MTAGHRELLDRGRAHLTAYEADGEPGRLDAALEALTAGYARLAQDGGSDPAADPAEFAEARALLGLAHAMRHWQLREQPDHPEDPALQAAALGERAEATDLLGLAVNWLDPAAADRTTTADRTTAAVDGTTAVADGTATADRTAAAAHLGLLLHARHEDTKADRPDPAARPDDLDRSISALRTALGHRPAHRAEPDHLDPDTHVLLAGTLGCALADHCDHTPGTAALRAATAQLEYALDLQSDLRTQLALEVRERLAVLLLDHPDTPDQLDCAVEQLEHVAADSDPDDPLRLRAALRLADLYGERATADRARPEDQDRRIDRLRDLRRLLPADDPYGATARWLLANQLTPRGLQDARIGPPALEAEDALRENLAALTADDPLRPPCHAVLGSLLTALNQRDPLSHPIADGVHHLETAVRTMAELDHGIRRADIANQLAHARLVAGQYGTDQGEVDGTIELLRGIQHDPSETAGFSQHVHASLGSAFGHRFTLSNSPQDLDAAIRHQTEAFRAAGPDDLNRVVYLQNLATSLHQRYQAGGDKQDLDAALRYYDEVLAHAAAQPAEGLADLLRADLPALRRYRLMLAFQLALTVRDTATMGRVVDELESLTGELAADDPLRDLALGDFGAAMLIHAMTTGRGEPAIRAIGIMVQAADRTPAGNLYKPLLTMRAAGALTMLAVEPGYSEHRARAALDYLDRFLADTDPDSLEGIRGALMRSALLRVRYQHGHRPADGAEAIASATAVRDRIRHGAPTEVLATVSGLLADLHRERLAPGDRAAGRDLGLAGLRETAAAALLQATADHALTVARNTAARALRIARWCLDDHQLGQEPGEPGEHRQTSRGGEPGEQRGSSPRSGELVEGRGSSPRPGELVEGRGSSPRPGEPGQQRQTPPVSEPAQPQSALRGAVEALELGRGLVLHASTATTDVPDQLRAAGHHDLAAAWQAGPPPSDGGAAAGTIGLEPGSLLAELPDGALVPMPDDLRRRALTALAAAPGGPGPATPPSVEEVGAALRAAGAHALAYLLPPGGGRNGEAVLVTADGWVELQPLTLVRAGSLTAVTAYRDAHRARQATLTLPGRHPERRAARHRWRAALAELCDWAGTAVLRPLLRHPALRTDGTPPRLVLVPFGEFGRVPWHAGLLHSGLRDGSRPVRAAERVVLSYAASARQFCQTAARERLPLDRHPVIVGDPARNLPGAEIEAEYLHADHYPDGTLLGYVTGARGPGTPAEVLAALPAPGRAGASVLHLACHARPLGRSPLEAHLELAPAPDGPPDSGRLPVADILRQAQGRPPAAPGGLVVLDACVSDHSDDDLDEALTLSTAFLAAGATGVIGSRWEVQDDQVGLLMYVLHGRLRLGDPPAEALRATQLWALDPDRRLPAGTPDELADAATGLDALEAWAAFGYQGR